MRLATRERLYVWLAELRLRLRPLKPFKGRIAATLLGAIAGGRLMLFGAAVGCLLGSMLDALAARSRDGEAAQPPAADKARIAAAQELKSLYALFGLEAGVLRSELAKAYKQRSRLCHPDARGGSADEFLALKKAYDRIRELEGQR